ncbi:MAG: hypothetical protein M1482_08380, partial [Chloroflexi bacterium]|nr:hypothetical protein [Chloroflexota bacterium]
AAVSAAHAALDAGMPGPSPEIQKTAADDAAHAIKPEVKPKRKNEQPAPKPKPKATEPMPPSFHPAPPETMSRSETDDETGDSNAEEQE